MRTNRGNVPNFVLLKRATDNLFCTAMNRSIDLRRALNPAGRCPTPASSVLPHGRIKAACVRARANRLPGSRERRTLEQG